MSMEIMEDLALSKAMEEGEHTPVVPEENILQLLSINGTGKEKFEGSSK
jgi:hypothetical protein